MFKITDEIIEEHIDKVIDVIDRIEEGKLTVLVGPNGVGKSLVRKQMTIRFYREYNLKNVVRSMSMELRTGSRADLGALSGIFRDNDVEPTSMCTYNLIEKMCHHIEKENKEHYYILDEPDIGMSRESEMGIADYILSLWPTLAEHSKGALVITHSDTIVNKLIEGGASFIYLGYNEIDYNYEKWENREIEPTNFLWLDEWSSTLFRKVRDRSKAIN